MCIAAVALLALAACKSEAEKAAEIANGPDPIAALKAQAPSTRYERAYWVETRTRDPGVWAQAVQTCEGSPGTRLPNCGIVREIKSAVDALQQPLPPKRPPISLKVRP